MKRLWLIFLLLLVVARCTTVPVTGRKQISLISNDEILPMSFNNYRAVLDTSRRSGNRAWETMVKQSGARIQKAVEEYMAQQNLSSALRGYAWEFNLIEADIANAWCMPGGKVAFYTGIMPICRDENGVAVVMGHEVAHAIANHGRERMSQGLMQQMGGVALNVALLNQPAETQMLYQQAFGVASTVGAMLPFSRLHESEADRMGLIFMAMAGYDPAEAPKFWERMAALSAGQEPPEFLSTHPSNQRRISELNALVPEAMQYYKKQE